MFYVRETNILENRVFLVIEKQARTQKCDTQLLLLFILNFNDFYKKLREKQENVKTSMLEFCCYLQWFLMIFKKIIANTCKIIKNR